MYPLFSPGHIYGLPTVFYKTMHHRIFVDVGFVYVYCEILCKNVPATKRMYAVTTL